MLGSNLTIRLTAITLFALLSLPRYSSSAEPELAPAPRTTYPRFELKHIPAIGEQGLIGFRPAEIARYAKAGELEVANQLFTMLFSYVFHEAQINAAEPPDFAKIEQCVFNLQMQVTTPKPDKKGDFTVGGKTPCMIRTVDPFDWATLMHKWFPDVVQKRLAGQKYLRLKIDTPATDDEPGWVGAMSFYCPDDRTLVVADEEDMFELLDRLAEEKPGPTPPPGWSDVDRNFAAFVLDLRQVRLITGKFPPNYPWGKDLIRLIDSCQTIAVGVSVDERTTLRIVGTTKNASATRTARNSLQKLIKAGRDLLIVEADEGLLKTMALDILKGIFIESSDNHFSLTTTADRNILELLINLSRNAD